MLNGFSYTFNDDAYDYLGSYYILLDIYQWDCREINDYYNEIIIYCELRFCNFTKRDSSTGISCKFCKSPLTSFFVDCFWGYFRHGYPVHIMNSNSTFLFYRITMLKISEDFKKAFSVKLDLHL